MSLVAKPAHVPSELVRDVDIYNLPGANPDPQLAWKALDRPGGPGILWTPRNGGHWIITSGQVMLKLLADAKRLSSSSIRVPAVPTTYPLIPSEADAPEHSYYRNLVIPSLSPRPVSALAEGVRKLARELIEDLAPRGHCEFMGEFARQLPIMIFLRLVDLPPGDREWLLARSEIMARSNDYEKRTQAEKDVTDYLRSRIDARRANPGTDMLSAIVHGKVGERPMTHEEIMGESMTLLFGGLDTVASMIGFIMRFLAKNPAHRQQLVDDPESIPRAIEELMRRHAIVAVARKALVDIEINGITMQPGDMVVLSTSLHSLDEAVYKDAEAVDFSRPRKPIATFGAGPHVCVGAVLARSEITIMLEEWLSRIPDFSVAPDDDGQVLCGTVNSLSSLRLSWH
jgi:cytochrome P450